MRRKATASKINLYKFKDYYRLEDAAKILSAELEEGVSVKDIYEYALHGSIKLSVMLGFQPAERAVEKVDPSVDHLRLDGFYHIDPDCSGFRELLIYESIGFEDPLAMLNLWVVKEVDDPGESYRLCRYGEENTFEWDEEPELSEIVVRRRDLEFFILEATKSGGSVELGKEPTVHPRRRNSYVKLIDVLLAELDLGLPEGPYEAAAVLQAMMHQRGGHLSDNTLVEIIEEVREGS